MELWFILAVATAVLSGISSFTNKIAAKRNYSAEVMIFYSVFIFAPLYFPIAIVVEGVSGVLWWPNLVALLAGVLAGFSGVFKVTALRYIDTTIYLPLFKVVSPLLAIVMGIVFFGESFSGTVWFGLLVSLLIPLLLITKIENSRQSNLPLGLIFVLWTGLLSALVAVLHKYATSISDQAMWIVFMTNMGVLIGSVMLFAYKHGFFSMYRMLKQESSKTLVYISIFRGVAIGASFVAFIYALSLDGPLGIVYTINSLYILIPIVLAIVFYDEHWSARKVVVIVLSVIALWLLG